MSQGGRHQVRLWAVYGTLRSVYESNRELMKPSWSIGNGTVSQKLFNLVTFAVGTDSPHGGLHQPGGPGQYILLQRPRVSQAEYTQTDLTGCSVSAIACIPAFRLSEYVATGTLYFMLDWGEPHPLERIRWSLCPPG